VAEDKSADTNGDLAALLAEVRSFTTCQHAMREELRERARSEETRLDVLIKAFSNDDPRGHREYHDALIAAAQQRVKIRQAVIEKSLTGLIWVGVVWVAYAIWQAFRHALGLN